MKKYIFLLIIILGAGGWFLYRTPFNTFDALKAASAENDSQRFNALVDVTAICQSLTQDLKNDLTVSSTRSSWPDNRFVRSAQALSETLIASVLKPVLTPLGMNQLLTKGTLDRQLFGVSPESSKTLPPIDLRDETVPLDATAEEQSALTETAEYEGFNYFKVKLQSEDHLKPVILTFKRHNLVSWRLVRIGFGL